MSVYLMSVLPNGFHEAKDPVKANEYIEEAIEKLKPLLQGYRFDIEYHDDTNRYNVDVYNDHFDLSIELHEGCWYIDSFFDSWEFFDKRDGEYYARDFVRRIAFALGIHEAWHITDDTALWGDYNISIEELGCDEWVKQVKATFDLIPDSSDATIAEMKSKYPDCYYGRPFVYHDSF